MTAMADAASEARSLDHLFAAARHARSNSFWPPRPAPALCGPGRTACTQLGECVVAAHFDPTGLVDADAAVLDRVIHDEAAFLVGSSAVADRIVVIASHKFADACGYAAHEFIGRNCRFLQGKLTDVDEVVRARDALEQHVTHRARLLNYRKDGSQFINELTFIPLRKACGEVVFTLAIQDCPDDVYEARLALDRAAVA